jgi:hypothetical protein
VGHPNEAILGAIEVRKRGRNLLGQRPQIVFFTGEDFEPIRKRGQRLEEVLLTPQFPETRR